MEYVYSVWINEECVCDFILCVWEWKWLNLCILCVQNDKLIPSLSLSVCVSAGVVCSEPDSTAAWKFACRHFAGRLHYWGPHHTLQLWRPQLHHLQSWHITGTRTHTKHTLLFYASCEDVCMWCMEVIMSLKFEQQQVPSDGWPIILHFTRHAKRLMQRHTHIVQERTNILGKMWGSKEEGGREFLSVVPYFLHRSDTGQLMALLSDKVSDCSPFHCFMPLNFILFLYFSFYIRCGNYVILDLELELSYC